jgi:hypothetical protein
VLAQEHPFRLPGIALILPPEDGGIVALGQRRPEVAVLILLVEEQSSVFDAQPIRRQQEVLAGEDVGAPSGPAIPLLQHQRHARSVERRIRQAIIRNDLAVPVLHHGLQGREADLRRGRRAESAQHGIERDMRAIRGRDALQCGPDRCR